ncbi:MAG: MarC family protein [Halioglobus sp.]|nr:MarC family protein [Halioglobus sp.]
MSWEFLLREFISIWVVVDPFGTIPVFISVTAGLSAVSKRAIAVKATIIATLILLFFIVAGQRLIEAMGIHLEAFQLAGGIVLFIFAMTMIFGDGKPAREKEQFDGDTSHLAIFPLAMPSLASPGAMLAVVMLTDNYRYSITEQFITVGIMFSVMLFTLTLLLLATPIQRIIGEGGASVISRVMGLILASVAVDNSLDAIDSFFNLGAVG